jgi:hypothetical protein
LTGDAPIPAISRATIPYALGSGLLGQVPTLMTGDRTAHFDRGDRASSSSFAGFDLPSAAMIRFATMLCMVALCACQPSMSPTPASSAPPASTQPVAGEEKIAPTDSSLVLPGAYSQQTTVADLEARFGKPNVKIVQEPGDPRRRSVVLFPDDPTRRAYATFHDDEALKDLASISVRDVDSLWRGKHGVQIGMSFAALRKLNGKPFWFYGFDSERRASARDQWSPSLDDDDGLLGTLDVEEGEHMYFGVELGLRDSAHDIPASAFPADDSVSSDDPRYPRLGELVVVTGFNASTSLDDEWE